MHKTNVVELWQGKELCTMLGVEKSTIDYVIVCDRMNDNLDEMLVDEAR